MTHRNEFLPTVEECPQLYAERTGNGSWNTQVHHIARLTLFPSDPTFPLPRFKDEVLHDEFAACGDRNRVPGHTVGEAYRQANPSQMAWLMGHQMWRDNEVNAGVWIASHYSNRVHRVIWPTWRSWMRYISLHMMGLFRVFSNETTTLIEPHMHRAATLWTQQDELEWQHGQGWATGQPQAAQPSLTPNLRDMLYIDHDQLAYAMLQEEGVAERVGGAVNPTRVAEAINHAQVAGHLDLGTVAANIPVESLVGLLVPLLAPVVAQQVLEGMLSKVRPPQLRQERPLVGAALEAHQRKTTQLELALEPKPPAPQIEADTGPTSLTETVDAISF